MTPTNKRPRVAARIDLDLYMRLMRVLGKKLYPVTISTIIQRGIVLALDELETNYMEKRK